MTRRARRRVWPAAFGLALWLAIATPALAIERFFGTYVGDAELVDLATGTVQERDVITVIQNHGERGFRIDWQSVVRVDGRRDVPGVRLFVRTAAFDRARGATYFLQSPDYDPFRIRETLEPMAGDALAWAAVEGDDLHLYIFALTDQGVAELQHHRRRLTDDGMELVYQGIVDGRLTSHAAGHMVKVD